MGKVKIAYRILVERPEKKRSPQDLEIDGRIILKRILKK
jgi:hypothetical protein